MGADPLPLLGIGEVLIASSFLRASDRSLHAAEAQDGLSQRFAGKGFSNHVVASSIQNFGPQVKVCGLGVDQDCEASV